MYLEVPIPLDPHKPPPAAGYGSTSTPPTPRTGTANSRHQGRRRQFAPTPRVCPPSPRRRMSSPLVLFPTVPGSYDAATSTPHSSRPTFILTASRKSSTPTSPPPPTLSPEPRHRSSPAPTPASRSAGTTSKSPSGWTARSKCPADGLRRASGQRHRAPLYRPRLPRRRARKNHRPLGLLSAPPTARSTPPSVFTTSFAAQDLCVEPTPIQTSAQASSSGSRTTSRSGADAPWSSTTSTATSFSGGQPPAPSATTSSDFTGTLSESLSGVSLLYGQNYEFRTRLADLTGGGPAAGDPRRPMRGLRRFPSGAMFRRRKSYSRWGQRMLPATSRSRSIGRRSTIRRWFSRGLRISRRWMRSSR